MSRLLTVCPSKDRPEMLDRMIESYWATVKGESKLLILPDNITPTECFNKAFKENPNFDYYHMSNDDVVYRTPGWDELLCNKNKISYGRDGIQNQNLCTFPVIDGNIVRALGWLQEPTLKKYCGDSVWMHIGERAHCLNYVSEVMIEHHHFVNNMRKNDDPAFFKTYSQDRMKYMNWEANESIPAIRIVRKVVNGHPNIATSESICNKCMELCKATHPRLSCPLFKTV